MQVKRLFTTAGKDPLSTIKFAKRRSEIKNPDGSVVFKMEDVSVPESWSQVATDIIAQKYFRKAGILGKIDLLVEEGFYSNRTDFIRTAIRNLLDTHQEVVKQVTIRRSMVVGALIYNRQDLEKYQERGEMLDMQVIGTIILDSSISPKLAMTTIKRMKVFGILKASEAVKAALAERINPPTS